MRRVTFSRNFTLSLSRTCRCYCKYCAFATHRAHLYAPEEVERLLEEAARRGAKELLVLTGEKPEVNPEVARRLAEHGHSSFVEYVAWACERALERGVLPHTNLGVLDPGELARLREVTASQGLMLESVSERLMDTVHAGSPTKHPARRLATIRAAGELRIPFTSGVLVGIGETVEERIASSKRSRRSTKTTATYRRSSSRTSFPIRATTAPSLRISPTPLSATVPEPRRRRRVFRPGPPRSRSTTCACSCASVAG